MSGGQVEKEKDDTDVEEECSSHLQQGSCFRQKYLCLSAPAADQDWVSNSQISQSLSRTLQYLTPLRSHVGVRYHKIVFLMQLGKIKEKHPFELHACCLMTNHFHMIVETGNTEIWKIMHKFLLSYASSWLLPSSYHLLQFFFYLFNQLISILHSTVKYISAPVGNSRHLIVIVTKTGNLTNQIPSVTSKRCVHPASMCNQISHIVRHFHVVNPGILFCLYK